MTLDPTSLSQLGRSPYAWLGFYLAGLRVGWRSFRFQAPFDSGPRWETGCIPRPSINQPA